MAPTGSLESRTHPRAAFGGLAETMFVHLTSGKVETVPAVTHVYLTESDLVLYNGEQVAAVYPRTQVYFACCGRDAEPWPS